MANETSFDLIVIGGGPGGYVAAIRAEDFLEDEGSFDSGASDTA